LNALLKENNNTLGEGETLPNLVTLRILGFGSVLRVKLQNSKITSFGNIMVYNRDKWHFAVL
jgi:hypothetical protein